jgi:HK97 family phage major capsid protein
MEQQHERLGDLTARMRDAAVGLTFTRTLRALALGPANYGSVRYAEAQDGWADRRAVVASLKASVEPMTPDNFPLATPAAYDLAQYLRTRDVLGRLQGVRRAPSRVRMITLSGGTTAYWVGSTQIAPISKAALAGETLERLTLDAITVNTVELARVSDPLAESVLRADMGAACVAARDSAFADPTNAGTPGVKPASPFFGATEVESTGSTLAEIDNDLADAIQVLIDGGSSLAAAQWILSPRTACYLSRLRGSGGALAHPQMTVSGGVLHGLPAIVSGASPHYNSPSTATIGLIDASELLIVDDGAAEFSASSKASISMEDDEVSPAATLLVSMFQVESIAFKTTMRVNWKMTRSGLVAYVSNVNY